MFYIYKMTHVPTGRVYIGQHKLPSKCLCPCLDTKYTGSGKIWKRIYKQHPDECEKSILAVAHNQEVIDKLEKEFIEDAKNRYGKLCVNLALGARGGVTILGQHRS